MSASTRSSLRLDGLGADGDPHGDLNPRLSGFLLDIRTVPHRFTWTAGRYPNPRYFSRALSEK
jgi:hypothetical protein